MFSLRYHDPTDSDEFCSATTELRAAPKAFSLPLVRLCARTKTILENALLSSTQMNANTRAGLAEAALAQRQLTHFFWLQVRWAVQKLRSKTRPLWLYSQVSLRHEHVTASRNDT